MANELTEGLWDKTDREPWKPGAPRPCEDSHATVHDGGEVTVPDGRKVADVPPEELRSILINLRIPGVDHSTGYAEMIRAFADKVAEVRKRGADAAEVGWKGSIFVVG